ncbi:hypothetical protein BD626DRAFT_407293 [Schizophyllum amplum]|uniref:N-acetyltransferase domain-containing protein n=1 Tax=Schizophyllum amplum TaxID=97359 RepID=A0A550C737_9AGAR|nr:hypothetical protein BD626DRAFT_407293 [Auriculariopsis ampla]
MTALTLNDVQVDCRVLDSASNRFLKPIYLTASHSQLGNLGKLEAYKITRVPLLKGRFFEVLDEKSSEMAEFGLKVLNDDMNVYPKNVEDDYQKGTGRWGYEMNEGNILYVHELEVAKEFENQGIATLLLEAFLTSAHIEKVDVAYCWPTPTRARSTAEHQAEVPRVTRVFRKAGFRRVGRTPFFGFSPDPAHPSRLLAAWRDLDIDPYKFPARSDNMTNAEARSLMQAFPIQTAMDPPFPFSWRATATAPEHLQNKLPTTEEIVALVHAAHASDPALLHIRDDQGFPPIYVAAANNRLPVVSALLSYGISAEEILSRDNAADRNAIEAYKQHLSQNGQMQQLLWRGRWAGHPDDTLIVGYMLRQAAGEDVGLLADYVAKERRSV